MIIQLHAEVKFVQLYTCSVCGAKERGETVRVEYDGTTSGLKDCLESQPLRSSRMPIGWFYNGAFRCPQYVPSFDKL